jgi:hypothetical protein
MPYTDIWRCKTCDVLPDIQMVGRSFRIACENCDRQRPVEGDSLNEVVSRWNKLHEPSRKSTGVVGWFREWTETVKGYVDYQRQCFRQSHERRERLKRTALGIREEEEKEDSLQAPMNLLGAEPDAER